jgi:hypothetical protein
MAGKRKITRISAKARALMLGAVFATTAVFSASAATHHHVSPAHIHPVSAHLTSHHRLVARHPVALASTRHEVLHHSLTGHLSHHVLAATYRPHHYIHAAHYLHSGLQCVPYAREVSHIELSGDAFLWWAEASGRYARGNTPAEGAVLNFRAIGRMPLGHVAVVTSVVDSRTILVTQANWVRGTITNDVTVQDVSPNNDWTQVEVELGDSSKWGASYPSYGFIYNQPDNGTVIAANGQSNEVAEAPTAQPVSSDAPDRNLQ